MFKFVFGVPSLFILCVYSLCQRLGLTRSVRNKPRARSASIERRRRESPPEAKDERSESFAGGARGFAKLCQRLGLTRSVRNKPRARSASIERRRRESPPEAKDERSESFAGGARGFAKQNRVFEHTHLPLCRPGVSIQRNHYQKMN